jgi:hypothetical protein
MKTKLAWVGAFVLSIFVLSSESQELIYHDQATKVVTEAKPKPSRLTNFMALFKPKRCNKPGISSLKNIQAMLEQPNVGMNQAVINKVITTLKCAQNKQTRHNNILTVIDYSKASNQKRLWVFDLRKNRMLFHTYVSHGIKSGALFTDQFSNRNNSKASSLGVYRTDQAYYGRHGLSLRLTGLEPGFNDRASSRAIVMHSAWYMDEDFIKKYGRPGRSWGCPAIPKEDKKPLIRAIKNNGLFVVYYPGERWVRHSKYLHCDGYSPTPHTALKETALREPEKKRAGILFVERNKNNKREENEPILVMSADHYTEAFHHKIPLTRMLRCQLNHQEYIALSRLELETLAAEPHGLDDAIFVRPEVKNIRGYYKTNMKVVNLGKIKNVTSPSTNNPENYTVTFDKKPAVQLKTTHRFIRWLGL